MDMDYTLNGEIPLDALRALFEQTSWAKGRGVGDLDVMLKNTKLHVSAWHDGRLVGFARAMSDTVYRAVIDDVVVDEAYRGGGVGAQLVKRLGTELTSVEEVFLGCDPSVVSFYEKIGYERAKNPYMKRPKGCDTLNE